MKRQSATFIFYESPHRLKETLAIMLDILGDRKIAICRELTKKFEEFIRGTIEEVIEWANEDEIRGEFCLIVEGAHEQTVDEDKLVGALTIEEHVNHYIT